MIVFILTTALMLSWSPEMVIKDYVMDNYPWPEIEVQQLNNNLKMPSMPPEKILLTRGLPGRSTFLMRFPSGRILEYEARINAFDWVIKSRRPIRRGEVIDEKDIYKTLLNIRQIPKSAVMNQDMVVGKTLRQSIPANRTIRENLIEDIPVIKRGQNVVLLFDNGQLNIKTNGAAKESGPIGKYIKVINISSKKQVIGKIIDNHTVKVGE